MNGVCLNLSRSEAQPKHLDCIVSPARSCYFSLTVLSFVVLLWSFKAEVQQYVSSCPRRKAEGKITQVAEGLSNSTAMNKPTQEGSRSMTSCHEYSEMYVRARCTEMFLTCLTSQDKAGSTGDRLETQRNAGWSCCLLPSSERSTSQSQEAGFPKRSAAGKKGVLALVAEPDCWGSEKFRR